MTVDWINVVSTFAAAIAGSWFGARATHHQTKTNLALAETQWKKERAFELIGALDEYLNFSFRKDTLTLPDRDGQSRKMLALLSIVLPERVASVEKNVTEVRKLHIGQPCNEQYQTTDSMVKGLRVELFALVGSVKQI